MTDPNIVLALASASLIAVGIASTAILKGWNGWLEIKRLELTGARREGLAPPGARIELSDLKERVRKLEAIANGVEL